MYEDLNYFFKNNNFANEIDPEIHKKILSKEFYEFYIGPADRIYTFFKEINKSDIISFPLC